MSSSTRLIWALSSTPKNDIVSYINKELGDVILGDGNPM